MNSRKFSRFTIALAVLAVFVCFPVRTFAADDGKNQYYEVRIYTTTNDV